MMHSRWLLIFAVAWLLAYPATYTARADEPPASEAPPPALRPPAKFDTDDIRAHLLSGQLGLKPQRASGAGNGIGLPFGLSYHSETRGLLVPMNEENTFGIGIGLNIGATPKLDSPAGGGLGLQLKGSPGIIFQKKF